ncbi:FAD/NAD(P)-binding oxidoreductase (plasmid) [Azospirillum humicireducens]|uniref:FAD/NAD(P)-binding oxidoreductase n=1 Tax=Azospirillum humicireducens TaxID=1226968 RepID=A0A2R4VQY4_9PROT|nr:NAD(P)/FAD-dependent oxidoreductase [Azospirillum humicireducens]AWB06858.1 FAD/NAD(P)-binding oxidoreductase [Azospirillum humicireducens]
MSAPKFDFDIAVVGSGPAGLAAAALAASKGASVVLLDEQAEPGGQIYRAVTETPVRDRKVLGPDYWHGAELLGPLRDSGAAHWPGATVWSVARPREDGPDGERSIQIGLSRNGAAAMLIVRHVILATGALERPFPIPGWTLPGVLGAGAAQVLLKTSGLVPSGATVMAGSGPLLWLLAWQYLQAGARIDAILDTTPKQNWRAALPLLPGFLRSPYLAKGMKLMLEVRRKLTVIGNVTALRADGDGALKSVTYTRNGTEHRLPADTLLLHHGVVPNLNLANATGCAQRWDEQQRCWRPTTDAWGATSVEGVSLAGDGAGIGGARAAEEAGRLAALDALHRLGRIGREQRDQLAAPHRAALDRALTGRAFLDTLYTPAEAFRAPADDTIVCRCEEITAGAVREAVRLGCSGPNQAKSFLRCGMGPCQGRLCGPTVTEVIAAERGVSPAEVGYYRLRPPVKPITLAELAALPKTDADIDAVFKH